MGEREKEPTLVEIVTALSEVYDDRGSVIWLTSPQKCWPLSSFDFYSAVELIRTGRAAEVMQRVDQLRSGAYS